MPPCSNLFPNWRPFRTHKLKDDGNRRLLSILPVALKAERMPFVGISQPHFTFNSKELRRLSKWMSINLVRDPVHLKNQPKSIPKTKRMSATGVIVCESKAPMAAEAKPGIPICRKPSMAEALPILCSKGTSARAAALGWAKTVQRAKCPAVEWNTNGWPEVNPGFLR